MKFIERLLGRTPARTAPAATLPPVSGRDATRRELVAMAVRDTLRKQGIPQEWIGAEASPALTARKDRGIHLRLVVRHWHPALPSCVVALQKSVAARMSRLDPLSCEWLVGISWKFEPADDRLCPALPEPGYWQAERPQPADVAARRREAADTRETLKRLLGRGDEAFAGRPAGGADGGFHPTQPMLMPGGQA